MTAFRPGRPFTAAELRVGGVVYLVDLEWAGRTWRFASESVDVVTDDGTVLHYAEAGVEPSWTSSIDLFQRRATPSRAALDRLFFGVDVPRLVAQGQWFERGTATLSQWVPGRTWEQRRVLSIGRLKDPQYGGGSDGVSLSIEPFDMADRALWPPPAARVTAATCPSAAEAAMGQPYPFPIGKPGLGLATSTQDTGVAPALLVDTSNRYLLVAGAAVAASSVVVTSDRLERSKSFSTTSWTDGLGRTCTVVQLDSTSTGGNIDANDGDTYRVDWSASSGGILSLDQSTALEGAGEVCEYLLRQSEVPFNAGAWAAVRRFLAPYKLAFYVDEPQTPWQLVSEAILPLLPVSVRTGPLGVEPVVWRVNAGATDAVMAFEDGRNVEVLLDGVQHVDPPVANEHRIDFAPRAGGTPYRSLTATGRDVATDDATVVTNRACRASRLTFGATLQADPVRTRVVYAEATARRCLAWRATAHAFPWRALKVAAVDAAVGAVVEGDVVTLTSSRLSLSDQVAHVTAVDAVGDRHVLSLVIITVPSRDAIPTGGA